MRHLRKVSVAPASVEEMDDNSMQVLLLRILVAVVAIFK